MVGKLPKALSKNPDPFVDVSAGLMNVPGSVKRMRADGMGVFDEVAISEGRKPNRVIKKALTTKRPKTFIGVKSNGRGFKAGRAEGKRLTNTSRKRASKILRK